MDGDNEAANLAVFQRVLEQACLELMASYGLPASIGSAEPQSGHVSSAPAPLTAEVDFGGRELRGTLTLRASSSVISETARHAPGMSGDPFRFQADWTCELANQLLGRMKSKLLAYNLSVNVNVPRLAATPRAAGDDAIRCRLVCACGSFAGYLDVLVRRDLVLAQPSMPPASVAEGDLVLL